MFGRRYTLARIFGFDIRVDLTWLIIAALIVWTLSAGYFPASYKNLPISTYFSMGLLGAIGLFVSIIAHELAHSIVARRLGMQIRGITLFAFGGAAEMADEPPTARAEFLMSIAGPVASVALALLFYLLGSTAAVLSVPEPIVAVLGYLSGINLILALFNVVPAFPLDGGRILRAVLWRWRGDVVWATRWAAQIGGAFGLALVAFGIYNVLVGDVLSGMWWFLLGLFIRAAAGHSYQQLLARRALEGVPVARFMTRNPITVPPDLPVVDLIEQYVLDRRLEMIPVVAGERLIGFVTVSDVKEVPRELRARQTAGDICRPRDADSTVRPDATAAAALGLMQRTGNSRLLVADGDRLEGIVCLKDMLSFLVLKAELG